VCWFSVSWSHYQPEFVAEQYWDDLKVLHHYNTCNACMGITLFLVCFMLYCMSQIKESLLCLLTYVEVLTTQYGRAMAQAVSRRPHTAEARVRSRVSPCGFCVGQSGNGTGFSPSTSVFPCQFYSIGAPLLGKIKKTDHLPFHLHHKGCTLSLKAAVCP
jgi:hypothetical protein